MAKKIDQYRINQSGGDLETHHIFLDTLAHSKERLLGISEKKFEIPLSRNIIYLLFGFFLLCTLVLFSRTFYLQVFKGDKLYTQSQNNRGRLGLIPAERGIIYDKNYTKLVVNAPDFDLLCDKRVFLTPTEANQKEISHIAGATGQTTQEITDLFNNSDASKVLIFQNIPQEMLLILATKTGDLPDCKIEENTVRNYAFSPTFSHLLGYTGKPSKADLENTKITTIDNVGKTGLEKYYQDYLQGTAGKKDNEENGKIITPVNPGNNLVLNIDAGLQKTVYLALEKSIKNIGSKKGAAVAIDPRTGAVLALVSYPAYDNNIFSQSISQADYNKLQNDPNQPFFNRVTGAKYPIGSTIKPFEAVAALQENLISPTKQINDPGYILVRSQNDPSISYRFEGVKPHGFVDMKKAIAVSSNVYFYTVGGGYGDQKGLGPARIKKYLDLFGFEQKTGIDLPGEFGGFVPSPTWKKEVKKEGWWDGDTYNLSIGQSDLQITPLQVAMGYVAIANGGTLYKPQIVKKVINGSGPGASIVQEFKPEITGQNFINPEYLQIVREGMRDAVQRDYGSSFMLNDLPVAVAGKTGTAETNKAGIFNTWSANFAPYDNPEIVFLATIEGVQGLRAATLPVAHDVLQWYFSQK